MKRETARELMQAITDMAQIAISVQNKFTALENALKDQSPDIYREYSEKLKQQPSTVSISLASLESLVVKLTQD